MMAVVSGGFAAAGYASIHMDDCWEQKNPPRDPTTHELRADFVRFPDGMKALGDYIHGKGLSFAIYSAESSETCGGYPASQGYESLDATTFASWGVGALPTHRAMSFLISCTSFRSCRLHQGRRMRR